MNTETNDELVTVDDLVINPDIEKVLEAKELAYIADITEAANHPIIRARIEQAYKRFCARLNLAEAVRLGIATYEYNIIRGSLFGNITADEYAEITKPYEFEIEFSE